MKLVETEHLFERGTEIRALESGLLLVKTCYFS